MPTGSVLHSMAGACGKYYGTKIYSTNARVRTAEFLFWLLDAETAKLLRSVAWETVRAFYTRQPEHASNTSPVGQGSSK